MIRPEDAARLDAFLESIKTDTRENIGLLILDLVEELAQMTQKRHAEHADRLVEKIAKELRRVALEDEW